jgi:hypothetical protein
MEWISVDERLPAYVREISGPVYISMNVICFDGKEVFSGEFQSGNLPKRWHTFRKGYNDERQVTHWMPLPNPPAA